VPLSGGVTAPVPEAYRIALFAWTPAPVLAEMLARCLGALREQYH